MKMLRRVEQYPRTTHNGADGILGHYRPKI
jgi:hypothetical protein